MPAFAAGRAVRRPDHGRRPEAGAAAAADAALLVRDRASPAALLGVLGLAVPAAAYLSVALPVALAVPAGYLAALAVAG